jgi:hypothetical protein
VRVCDSVLQERPAAMPKSKHRRKGKNRPRAGLLPASSFDPEVAELFADAEADEALADPEMAEALALAEEELAAEIAAADDEDFLDPEDEEAFGADMAPLRQVVEDQLRANDPPEVAATLARLVAAGHARDDAVALIGAALIVELNEIMRSEREYDAARYARNLANLPALPALD